MKKIFFLLFSVAFIASCVKQEFDKPNPAVSGGGLDFKSNFTIAELKKLHKSGGLEQITDDKIIEATVIGDDESGNVYKSMVIQDATAGIEVKINATSLYNDFKVGSKILIKCKDLTLGDYNGLTQLGGGTADVNGSPALAGIEQALITTYIFKGGAGTPITPRIIKIADLTNDLASTLIQIDNAEFAAGSFGLSYADGVKKLTVNRNVTSCVGGTIVVRTSGYANFANDLTPTGNGSIVGIYTVFGATKQLLVRSPIDAKMTDKRCDGTGGGGTGGGTVTGDPISIGEVRAIYTGTKTTVTANKLVSGVVISDASNKNVSDKNCIIQGADGKGIMVRFTAAHPFLLGDAVDIAAGGLELSEFNGTLQINAVPLTSAKKTGAGTLPAPKKVTIAQVIGDIKAYESTLIAIDNCAHPGTKYGGNIIIDDKTGKMTLYTTAGGTSTTGVVTPAATFATAVPVSTVLNLVGIAGQYATATNTTYQIQMRNLSDATKGAGGTAVGGGGTGGAYTVEPIGNIRNLFTGTLLSIPTGKGIKGVVISDAAGKNASTLNCVIQGEDGKGITIRFAGAHTFPLGETIEINLGGVELSEYNGLLQLNKVPLANATSKGAGTLPKPTIMTIADYITNFENVESTLVQINNASVTGGKYFDATRGTTNGTKGTVKLDDGTGTIDIYTVTAAVFAAETAPTGKLTVTGIASEFTAAGGTLKGVQLLLRNASDVK